MTMTKQENYTIYKVFHVHYTYHTHISYISYISINLVDHLSMSHICVCEIYMYVIICLYIVSVHYTSHTIIRVIPSYTSHTSHTILHISYISYISINLVDHLCPLCVCVPCIIYYNISIYSIRTLYISYHCKRYYTNDHNTHYAIHTHMMMTFLCSTTQ